MKRRTRDSDSLELLLDTICNMFGGLVFIAMLLAVLTGAKSDSIVSQAGAVSPSQLLRLRTDLEVLESRVTGLEAAAADAEAAAAIPESGADLTLLRERLGGDIDGARFRLGESQARLKLLQDRDRDLNDKVRDGEIRLRELEASAKALLDEISLEKQSRVATARLPVTRTTNKIPWHLILRNQRVYEVYAKDGEDLRFNNRDVVGRPLSERRQLVTPKESGGFVTGPDLTRHPRWRQLVTSREPGQYFLYLMVYRDSFDTFRAVRDAALRSGFEYEVVLVADDEEIILEPASSFTTQ